METISIDYPLSISINDPNNSITCL